MPRCDPTPRTVDLGMTLGFTADEAGTAAERAARTVQQGHPCPAPCESWFSMYVWKPVELSAEDVKTTEAPHRKLYHIRDADAVIVVPTWACGWELRCKCVTPETLPGRDPHHGARPY